MILTSKVATTKRISYINRNAFLNSLKIGIILFILAFHTFAFCSEEDVEVKIENFINANPWQDARNAIKNENYFLIELVPFGTRWIPSISKADVNCWKNKYPTKIIWLSDGITGYGTHIDNVLRKEYAKQFNKLLTKVLIRNKIEDECRV